MTDTRDDTITITTTKGTHTGTVAECEAWQADMQGTYLTVERVGRTIIWALLDEALAHGDTGLADAIESPDYSIAHRAACDAIAGRLAAADEVSR